MRPGKIIIFRFPNLCKTIEASVTYINKHKHMSHFAYACKMRCPLNLVLEKSEYLWFY